MKSVTTKALPNNTHVIGIVMGMTGLMLIAMIIQLTH